MIDDHRTLPGHPRKALVLKVRQALNRYGIRPYAPRTNLNQLWRDTWEWAYDCRSRYNVTGRGKKLRFGPDKWPQPREIATQYMFLLLTSMQNDHQLCLPTATRPDGTHHGRIPEVIAAAYQIPQRSPVPLLVFTATDLQEEI